MSAVKKTISVSEELVKEANEIASNFSAVVEAALIEYLHHYRLQKAKESFGKWQERKDTSVDLVNKLRQEGGRKYANRHD
ncbi:MAG: hypothetical protein EPO11_01210 [Gammaproteobacteria bacterium]|nr:MAG: hypothetical protein EPO11_01210 [Gammaproteobacteria bacterium]